MSKKPRIHPLGYDMDAPLPYMLTDEELFGKYKVREEEYTEVGKAEVMHLAETFANFLNESAGYNPEGFRPQISEELFVKSYLPHFHSEAYVDKDRPKSTDAKDGVITSWVGAVAGSIYSPVDITRNGVVIYRVPPASGQLKPIGPNDRQRSLNLLIKDAEDMYNRLNVSKNAQLTHALNESMANIIHDPESDRGRTTLTSRPNLKFLFVLDEIFTYYGYSSILTPEIMSLKSKVFGADYVNNRKSNRPVSTAQSSMGAVPVEDDDDLFG